MSTDTPTTDDKTTAAPLRVTGVARDQVIRRGLLVYLNREPTDFELRAIHSSLRITVNE